jgi:demethylmenaquinone methyltransferase / 2-methoxy-6-polyprenyl-1,4-benzoquinol methylase
MAQRSSEASARTKHARRLFAGIASSYEPMGAILSLGQDGRWRRFMVSRLDRLTSGGAVLDVASGTGLVARQLVHRTGAAVVAVDISEPMLRQGMRRARADGEPVLHVLGQGERLPFADAAFDAVTFTYLLRYVDDPPSTVAELARVLRPEGTLANVEFHLPPSGVWRWGWDLYTGAVMPLMGRLLSASWYEAARFLRGSIRDFYRRHPLHDQLDWWRRAGIGDVRHRVMSLGTGVVIWGVKGGH